MDPKTNLLLGVTGSIATRKFEMVCDELDIGGPIDPTAFRFHTDLPVNSSSQPDWLLPLGTPAPPFTGTTMTGEHFDLKASLKGAKVLLIDFWGIGCAPCKAELPGFEDWLRRYGSKGLKVVTVALASDREILAKYAREAHMTLPVVLSLSCKPDVIFDYKATTEPTTYLINSKGIIVGRYVNSDLGQIEKDLRAQGL